jgi:hypothetical protein
MNWDRIEGISQDEAEKQVNAWQMCSRKHSASKPRGRHGFSVPAATKGQHHG